MYATLLYYGRKSKLSPYIQLDDRHGFGQMLRMTPEEFDFLLGLVEPIIRKRDTWMRRAITPSQRLSLTLRFLATGIIFSYYWEVVLISDG